MSLLARFRPDERDGHAAPLTEPQQPTTALISPQPAAVSGLAGLLPLPYQLFRAWRLYRALDFFWMFALGAIIALVAAGLALAIAGPLASSPIGYTYKLGNLVDFRAGGDGAHYSLQGWDSPEEDGTRTRGSVAHLLFPAHVTEQSTLRLRLLATPIFAAAEDRFWVDILINGARAGRFELARGKQLEAILDFPYDAKVREKPVHVTLVLGSRYSRRDSGSPESASALRIETVTLS